MKYRIIEQNGFFFCERVLRPFDQIGYWVRMDHPVPFTTSESAEQWIRNQERKIVKEFEF